MAPTADSKEASARKAQRMSAPVAPSALSRPISPVRWATATNITFITRMPATARLIAAMPPTARVRAPSSRSKVASTASWVMTVTSSSPPWRCLRISLTCAFAAGMASRLRASTMMRNRVLELNMACASATGTMTSSSVFMPSPWPVEPRTPTMRTRRSPMRVSWPTAGWPPKSSSRILAPITATGAPRFQSSSGRKLPCAMTKFRTSRNCEVEPATMTSRRRPPKLISEVPTISGARRFTAGARCSAAASLMVRSRGVVVMAFAGLKPPVPERPGRTMTRLVPSEENWPTT